MQKDMPTLEITFFGGFSIKQQGRIITDQGARAKQLWLLLEYLIANRNAEISQEKLIELLWPGEECENPANAVKNLVYRARKLLAGIDANGAENYIVYRHGNYAWNSEIPCRIDLEELKTAYKAASLKEAPTERRLSEYKKVMELYKGEFLPQYSDYDWVVMQSTYYCRLYMESAQTMAGLLAELKRYDEAIAACEAALTADSFDESLHELLIRIYIKAGYRLKAVSHYEYISKLFYEKLGVKLSESIRNLMREMIKSMNGVETDLDVIKSELRESERVQTAFYCEYEIFKNLYRIQARYAERLGQSVFVALLTIECIGASSSDKNAVSWIEASMETVRSVILHSLRKSDVFSRYSKTQYVLMLPALTYENGQAVLKRILQKFNEQNRYKNIIIGTKLNPLDPAA